MNPMAQAFVQLGLKVQDAKKPMKLLWLEEKPCIDDRGHSFPTIYGIGNSVIYFVDKFTEGDMYKQDFDFIESQPVTDGFGYRSY